MMTWKMIHPQAGPEMLGYLPSMVSDLSPKSAREQFNDAYSFAGGWTPFKGFTMLPDRNLSYPGDPPTQLLAETKLRDETILFYDHAWVAIVQPDGSFEVCRKD